MIDLKYGDCLELMKDIPNGSVDMVLTDPPYGTTACKWDSVIPFEPMWEQLKRITKPNGAIVFTASQPFTSNLVMSNPKMFKVEWIWEKNAGSNFATVKYMPMKEHESVLVFSNGGGKTPYFPIKEARSKSGIEMLKSDVISKKSSGFDVYGGANSRGYNTSLTDKQMRCPRSIQKFNRERGLHPTQKPVILLEYLIKTYTQENEVVLDFTMGSGSTGVACVNTNRKFIGIEMDDKYFEIAEKRIKDAQCSET